jgi:hypothetical protein
MQKYNISISHLVLSCVASCTPQEFHICSFSFVAAAVDIVVTDQASDPYISVRTLMAL